jgi:hypothetical protein
MEDSTSPFICAIHILRLPTCFWVNNYQSTLAISTLIKFFVKALKFSKHIFFKEHHFLKKNRKYFGKFRKIQSFNMKNAN